MKKKHPRAAAMTIRKGARRIARVAEQFSDDGVTVYAAQATFYIIVGSVPFLMLLIALSKYVAPETIDTVFNALHKVLPERFDSFFTAVYNELSSRAGISVMSITALAAFWSSSRAIASVTRGVAFIYDADSLPGTLRSILYSMLYTIAFVILIIGVLSVLVFGVTLKNVLVGYFPGLGWLFSMILNFRGVFFFIILTLFFSVIYYAVSKNMVRAPGTIRKYRSQIPGALFAAAGWMLFSYFFSLYMHYFPSASYIYGSLAAVMLFMLWMYFCMIILLAGAEINKYLNK